jgi:hypothetical protein
MLVNDRRGPEVVILAGPADASSPTAPWSTFTVAGYMNVTYPTKTTDRYQLEIRDFFRVHPVLVVKAFAQHERVFPFPATHCIEGADGGGPKDGAGPAADGGSSSGSPTPQQSQRQTHAPSNNEGNAPGAGDTTATSWTSSLPDGKYITFTIGGLLTILGTLAMAWLRRRRSAK